MPSLTIKPRAARRVPLFQRFRIWMLEQRMNYLLDERKIEWCEIDRAKDRIVSLDDAVIEVNTELSALKLK